MKQVRPASSQVGLPCWLFPEVVSAVGSISLCDKWVYTFELFLRPVSHVVDAGDEVNHIGKSSDGIIVDLLPESIFLGIVMLVIEHNILSEGWIGVDGGHQRQGQ